VAKREKVDHVLENRFSEFDKRVFVLKIEYEKYFSGLTQIEPVKERDELRRIMRNFQKEFIPVTRQKYRLRMLRARFSQIELYWNRNLVMIERGTHPKMKFRADLHDKERRSMLAEMEQAQAEALRRKPRKPQVSQSQREDKAYRQVFDSYMKLRKKTGQSHDMSYDSVRATLSKQVRTIKSRYRCKTVKFKVSIEDGKAKVKAVPVR